MKLEYFKSASWDFLGGPVVKNPSAKAGTQVRSLILDPHAAGQLSLCTTSTRHAPWSPHALAPKLPNKRSHCSEKPMQCNWRESPAHCNWRKPMCSSEDLAQPKINKILKNLLFQILKELYDWCSLSL